MSAFNLRLVYDADAPAPPPRPAPRVLTSTVELEPLIHERLQARRDEELKLEGHGTARLCLFEGKIAWIRLSDHPEHLGDVMRRELGLSDDSLRRAIAHCRTTGTRFDEGMVSLGLVQPAELRDCLHRHLSDQLWEVLEWPGPLTWEQSRWPHRYAHAYTFDLEELMARPHQPSAAEQRRLAAAVEQCRRQLPRLQLACVIEAQEGTVLHSGAPDEGSRREAEDLLSLCTAGLRRLAANRITRHDSPPEGMLLNTKNGCLVVQNLTWHPDWLLVLGGREQPGRLLTVAHAVAHELP